MTLKGVSSYLFILDFKSVESDTQSDGLFRVAQTLMQAEGYALNVAADGAGEVAGLVCERRTLIGQSGPAIFYALYRGR